MFSFKNVQIPNNVPLGAWGAARRNKMKNEKMEKAALSIDLSV
jgi:hypothetical protein